MKKTEKTETGENRKALPKFLLIILASLIVGGVLGVLVAFSQSTWLDAEAVSAGLEGALRAMTPWAIPVTTLITMGLSAILYRTAAGKYRTWDSGDEDDTAEAVDRLLNWVLLLSAVQMLVDLFFLAAIGRYAADGNALTGVGGFFVSLALLIVFQQKAVDLTRRMNPEKKGSVYDTRFRKKWLESCDESERRQIGEASYQAYTVTNRVCLWLWMVLVILSLVFDIGLLPVLTVMIPWGTLQVAYVAACIRMGRSAKRQ